MPDILSLLSIAFLPLLITIIPYGVYGKSPYIRYLHQRCQRWPENQCEILAVPSGIFPGDRRSDLSGAMGFLQETTLSSFSKKSAFRKN